jgi:hypothetical protein
MQQDGLGVIMVIFEFLAASFCLHRVRSRPA